MPAAGDDHKRMRCGALDWATGQVIWQQHAQKGTQAFTACLTHLAATLPADAPVVVVRDTASYHKRRAHAALWQRATQRLQPSFLPTYAPPLNLSERLWRSLTARWATHRWWHDLDRLQQAAGTLLSHLTVHFHADKEPAFRLVRDVCQPA
jgi:hypothetical protein